jgi:hypothetical protein
MAKQSSVRGHPDLSGGRTARPIPHKRALTGFADDDIFAHS